jgi:membrane protein DedA with SNARE-associated domain
MPGSRHQSVPSPGARRVALLVALLALIGAASFVGDAMSPVLLRQNRLALVALTPRSAYVVAAARDAPFPLLLLVSVARLGVADPVHFVLGREAGPAVLARAQRTRVLGRVARRLPSTPGHLWLSAVAISPTAKTMVVAGGLGLPAGRVAVANLAGTVARVLVVWTAGRAFPSAGEAFAVLSAWVAAPCAVGAASLIVLRHRQRLRSALARRLGARGPRLAAEPAATGSVSV